MATSMARRNVLVNENRDPLFGAVVPSTSRAAAAAVARRRARKPLAAHNGGAQQNALLGDTQRQSVAAAADASALTDHRVLCNLAEAERCCLGLDYLAQLQPELHPFMREQVTDWMADVCAAERAGTETFALAVQLLDRFLMRDPIFACQLQAAATACLLIAGKVKLPLPFTGSRLCAYTDHSVKVGELLSWEMMLLGRLDWDVATPTATDFADQLLARFKYSQHVSCTLRHECNFALTRLLKDYELSLLPPSVQAFVCLSAAAAQRAIAVVHADLQSVFELDATSLLPLVRRLLALLHASETRPTAPSPPSAAAFAQPSVAPGTPSLTPNDVQGVIVR